MFSAVCCTASVAVLAASSASNSSSTLPSLTSSPKLTLMLLTIPAAGLGTSTEALSDSSKTTLSSTAMRSPTFTKISATVALSTPISGVLMCILSSPHLMALCNLQPHELLDGSVVTMPQDDRYLIQN